MQTKIIFMQKTYNDIIASELLYLSLDATFLVLYHT